MVCINCGYKLKTVNSRRLKRLDGTWRRKFCNSCKLTITTIELIDYPSVLAIKTSPSRLEAFQRDKLLISVFGCLKHRQSPHRDATALTDTIIAKLLRNNDSRAITKPQVMLTTTEVLQRFDTPAAVQYAALHPISFGDR